MSDYAPGPIVLGDMPLSPPIGYDGLFAALLEPVVNALGGADVPLATAQTAIAGNVRDGLDARYATTIGAAEAENAAQPAPGADQTAAHLHDAGQGADVYRASVLGYLPQPDAPVGQGFREFPTPDFGSPNQDPGANPPPDGI